MSVDTDQVTRKKILMICSNPATSEQTGWPIGFWWAELTHSYWEFVQHGYEIDIASPRGGPLEADSWSDPRDDSQYSAEDLITLGFVNSPGHRGLLADTITSEGLSPDGYDGIFLVGGQGPMYTFFEDEALHHLVARFYEAGKVTAVVCHATCVLLKTRLSTGELLVDGKTWTGFANSEEDYADAFVGSRIQPFRIEDEARALAGTNFVVQGRFRSHAVRDGLLVTGQQQYSGAAAARQVIEVLGR